MKFFGKRSSPISRFLPFELMKMLANGVAEYPMYTDFENVSSNFRIALVNVGSSKLKPSSSISFFFFLLVVSIEAWSHSSSIESKGTLRIFHQLPEVFLQPFNEVFHDTRMLFDDQNICAFTVEDRIDAFSSIFLEISINITCG